MRWPIRRTGELNWELGSCSERLFKLCLILYVIARQRPRKSHVDLVRALWRSDVSTLCGFSELLIWLSSLLISVKVYRGRGSLGNNYPGQLLPSAWNNFLFQLGDVLKCKDRRREGGLRESDGRMRRRQVVREEADKYQNWVIAAEMESDIHSNNASWNPNGKCASDSKQAILLYCRRKG